ncbi:hypothetical protein [Haloarcula halophila]|uniref:hypothetical protein n=1 Tax=Haloarcula TaxID=2237 RepID=UPI0023E4603F|nr:hypothetical protein [Halomicroarcula sp. DFY41]
MTEDGPPVDTDLDRDRAELHQQADVGRDHSRLYRLFAWLADNALLVGGVLGLVIFAVAAVIGVDIPRNVRIIGLSGLISLVFLGRPTGKKVRSMLWDPNYIWIVDVDARVLEGGIFHMPAQRFQQWTVTEGSLDWVSPNLAFGKQVDLVEQTVEGTWRGTLSDRELMRAIQAVEECRGQLEEDAKRGFAIESQAFTIVRNATRKAVFRIVETFENGTLPDEGESITEEIDGAVERFGLERLIRHAETDDSPESDVPGVSVNIDQATDDAVEEAIEDATEVSGDD